MFLSTTKGRDTRLGYPGPGFATVAEMRTPCSLTSGFARAKLAAATEIQGELLRLLARIGIDDELAYRYPAIVTDVRGFVGRWVRIGCGRVIHAADLLARSVEPPESSDLAGGNLYVWTQTNRCVLDMQPLRHYIAGQIEASGRSAEGRMVLALEHIRRLRGLSQRELAEKAGVSPATVYELEVGKRPTPRPSTLRKLAGALEVEISDLLGVDFPKAQAPLPEASFDELMDAERRGGATDADIINDFESITRGYRLSWRGALEALAAPWEVRLRSGDFDRSMVEQFFTDVAAVSQGVALALSTSTTDTLLQRKYKPPPFTAEDFEEIQQTGATYAAAHLLAVSEKVYAAAAERFAPPELEIVRQKRDEARRALRAAA